MTTMPAGDAVAGEPLALLSLSAAETDGPEAVACTTSWLVPHGSRRELAAALTARFGQPVAETLSTIDGLERAADRDEEAGAVYSSPLEAPGGNTGSPCDDPRRTL
jgi:hypothetical protein